MKLTLALLMAGVLVACGGGDPSSAATVNGAEITVSQVEEQYEALAASPQMEQMQQQPDADDEQIEQQIQAEALSGLIFEQVMFDAAEDMDISASDEDVEQMREEFAMQFGGDEEAMYEQLQDQGIDREEVDRQMEVITLQEALMEELGGGVSDEDIEALYEEGSPARHILTEGEDEASSAMERIEDGEDFSEVAQEASMDGSAEQGGDLGFVSPGETVPEFEDALFAADEGELVGPVESEFGYHVIERMEKPEIDEVRDELEMGLQQQTMQEDQMAFQEFITEEMAESEIEVNPRFGEWDPEMGQVVPDDPLPPPEPEMPQEMPEEMPEGGEMEEIPEELEEQLEELEDLEELEEGDLDAGAEGDDTDDDS